MKFSMAAQAIVESEDRLSATRPGPRLGLGRTCRFRIVQSDALTLVKQETIGLVSQAAGLRCVDSGVQRRYIMRNTPLDDEMQSVYLRCDAAYD